MEINKIMVMEGCIHWYYDINDKPLDEYTPEERRNILHKLIDMCSDDDIYNMTQEAMKSACEQNGEYECDDEPCECCGDFTCTWTYNREKDEQD